MGLGLVAGVLALPVLAVLVLIARETRASRREADEAEARLVAKYGSFEEAIRQFRAT